jgi:polar amino acid transport system substrate-binding protein
MQYPLFAILGCLILLVPAGAGEGPGTLRLGCDPTPPYIEMVPGPTGEHLGGLWVETVAAVLAGMGQEHAPFQLMPWNRLLRTAEIGEVDGLFGITRNPEREAFLHFPAEPLLSDPWVVWVRAADAERIRYTAPEDLAGRGVGLVMGYNYGEDFLARLRAAARVEEVAEEQTNFRKLAADRIDALVATLQVGTRTAAAAGLTGQVLPLTAHPVKRSVFHAAFRRDRVDAAWIARFSDQLAAFKRTPAYAALWRRYGLAGEP